ncbi:hypothetical protein IJH23_00130 [Candidatus Saccharibacteria bacterium]|nr:hypothetical protein [Candidatus Saccharibacteria bacterium]
MRLKFFYGTIIVTLTVSFLIGLCFWSGKEVRAEESSVKTRGTACTFSGTVSAAHTASVINGELYQGIGETVLKANCDDNNGFAIYAVGYTDDVYGKTVMSASMGQQYDINTGIVTSGDESSWAMKLNMIDGLESASLHNGFNNYRAVPSAYTLAVSRPAATTTTDGVQVKTTYAVYISPTQALGLYEGKVRYIMVHPSSEAPSIPQETQTGRICYYANAPGVLGTMGCQNIASEVTLLTSNFSLDGYGFAGWSDRFDYTTNPEAKFYGPSETISLNVDDFSGTNSGLSLYAVWVEPKGSLQDADQVASVCNGLTAGATDLSSVSALTDQRDGQTYAIAKLADGKCWMIENLRLESTAEHNNDGTLAQGYHSSFIGLPAPELTNFNISTADNDLYTGEDNIPGKITISGTYAGYRFPRYNNTNTSARALNPTTNNGAMYSYGHYYTWHAAIADTTHNGSNNLSSDSTSICPRGWRLPRGGQTTVDSGKSGDFYVLTKSVSGIEPNNTNSESPSYSGIVDGVDAGKLASNSLRSYPNNFIFGGHLLVSSTSGRGGYGSYWTSTARSNANSYNLGFSSDQVYPGTNSQNKFRALGVRCVNDF